MTEELRKKLSVLDKDLASEEEAFNMGTCKFSSVPQSLRGIPERIIGKWAEESNGKVMEYEKLITQPFFKTYQYCFREEWYWSQNRTHFGASKATELIKSGTLVQKGDRLFLKPNGTPVIADITGTVTIKGDQVTVTNDEIKSYSEAITAVTFLSLIVALVIVGIIGLVFKTPILLPWSLLTLFLSVGILLGGPVYDTLQLKNEVAKFRSTAREELEKKINRLWTEPVFLISEVQNHLTGVSATYRHKLTELEASFKNAVVGPRAVLKQRLAQLQADKKALQELKDDELPEKAEFITLVEEQIKKCKAMLNQATIPEQELHEKFRALNRRLDKLEQNTGALSSLKANYEHKEQLLKRFKHYAEIDALSWEEILNNKRERELQEIRGALAELNEEVVWTNDALTEVTAMLPAADFYQLPAMPSA